MTRLLPIPGEGSPPPALRVGDNALGRSPLKGRVLTRATLGEELEVIRPYGKSSARWATSGAPDLIAPCPCELLQHCKIGSTLIGQSSIRPRVTNVI